MTLHSSILLPLLSLRPIVYFVNVPISLFLKLTQKLLNCLVHFLIGDPCSCCRNYIKSIIGSSINFSNVAFQILLSLICKFSISVFPEHLINSINTTDYFVYNSSFTSLSWLNILLSLNIEYRYNHIFCELVCYYFLISFKHYLMMTILKFLLVIFD